MENTSIPLDLSAPRPGCVVLEGEFDDLDRLADVVSGWGVDWVQLDCGPLQARIRQVSTRSIQLSRFGFSRKFHQRMTMPPGMRTFGVVAPESPPFGWRGVWGSQKHLVVFPTDAEFEALSLPGFCGDTVTLSEKRLFEVADSLGLLDPIRNVPIHQAVVESDPYQTAVFRRRLDDLHILADKPGGHAPIESVVADAESGVISALVGALSAGQWNESRPELCSRSRAFRVAIDYIREHASTSPSVEEICRVAGVSWRTLNYAFRERFDLTPKQYLKAVRLKQVRRDLVTSDPGATIAEISARSGFWHMGQLAKDYRRQFDELPSETRSRS